MNVSIFRSFFSRAFGILIPPYQMTSETPLDWSQHVVNNSVILVRLAPMLKVTEFSVATDAFAAVNF